MYLHHWLPSSSCSRSTWQNYTQSHSPSDIITQNYTDTSILVNIAEWSYTMCAEGVSLNTIGVWLIYSIANSGRVCENNSSTYRDGHVDCSLCLFLGLFQSSPVLLRNCHLYNCKARWDKDEIRRSYDLKISDHTLSQQSWMHLHVYTCIYVLMLLLTPSSCSSVRCTYTTASI